MYNRTEKIVLRKMDLHMCSDPTLSPSPAGRPTLDPALKLKAPSRSGRPALDRG